MRKQLAEEIIRIRRKGVVYQVPASILSKYIFLAEGQVADPDDKSSTAGAKYLRHLRLSAGYTCKELAQLAGMDQSDIRKMEIGKLSIGKTRAIRLAKVLNTNFFSLISIPE